MTVLDGSIFFKICQIINSRKKMSNKKILFLLDYYNDKITPFLYEWKPFLIIL